MAAEFESVCEDILWVKGNREGIVPRSLSPKALYQYFRHTYKLKTLIGQFAIDNKIDIIWTVNEAYLAGPLAAKFARIPNCSQVFGMTAFRTPVIGKLLAIFHKRYTFRIIPCQDVIANELDDLGYPNTQINVVYNGVDVEKINSTVNKDIVTKSTEKSVGMVAGLDPRKGHLLFLNAASEVLKTVPDTKFYIIGNIEGNDDYMAQIDACIDHLQLDKHVVKTGKVDNVYDYLTTLDVHCIPSKIEALSVAGLEAMALNKPVVATNVGGNHIAVKHGETGLLTKPEDSADLASAIIQLLNDNEKCIHFGNNGRRLIEELFTLEKSAAELHTIFSMCLEQSSSTSE